MPWQKGQSGNPKGRRRSPEVLALVLQARAKCAEAIATACDLLDSPDGKIAMQAAQFIRDTGMGRPSQVEFDLAQVSDDDLLAEIVRRRELAKQREQQPVGRSALDS